MATIETQIQTQTLIDKNYAQKLTIQQLELTKKIRVELVFSGRVRFSSLLVTPVM